MRPGLLDINGSSSARDSLTEAERRFIGVESNALENGHRPQPKRVRSLEDLLAAYEDKAEYDWRRWAGLIAGEVSE